MTQRALIPKVGVAEDFFAERQYIQFQRAMEPAGSGMECLAQQLDSEYPFPGSSTANGIA